MRGQDEVEEACRGRGEELDGEDGVEESVGEEVLGGLDALGERLAIEGLVDARAEEADRRAGLADRDVTERTPRGEDPAGRGVAEVGDVGQVLTLVGRDGRRDLDHRHERGRALLHARATRGGGGEEGEALAGGSLEGEDDAFGRGDADGAREEPELPGDDGDAVAADATLAGDDGLVGAGLLGSGGELGGIRAVGFGHGDG